MHRRLYSLALAVVVAAGCTHRTASTSHSEAQSVPVPEVSSDPIINKVREKPVSAFPRRQLRTGDRLAVCGDSITEQRMYSRIIETYLTVCAPELQVTVRQYGWSGERADGFRRRMDNDVLRFQPTIATTCYGMNDHQYRPFEPAIGEYYRTNMLSVVRAFKEKGVRVILGSPGCVGKVPSWVKGAGPTTADLNLNLATLRNIDIDMARQEDVAFADIFGPMYAAGVVAQSIHGTNYAIPGSDGVHPDWAGQTVMAWAFLHAMGLHGEIGTFTIDARRNTAEATSGHTVVQTHPGEYVFESRRYPFCAPTGDPTQHNSIRSGFQWVRFQQDLNRLTLIVKKPKAKRYKLTWGKETRSYTAEELQDGINLAAEFANNPFVDAFTAVDEAVAKKQAYETKQIKQEFHGAAGKADMEGTVRRTEAERAPLAAAIQTAFKPVTHTLRLQPE